MRSTLASIFVTVAFISVTAVSAQWVKQDVATTASFRGLSVVNEKVVWASGTGGTVIRTIDGGKKWDVIQVPDAAKLDFRDIEAFDANTAYILSIGNGESSRIYKTTDGGKSWKEQFRSKNEKAFFDAMACWDKNNCIAMSDPVDRKYVLIGTKNGGSTWTPIDTTQMPEAKEGEAAFAASGTCLITQGKTGAFLVTGGSHARVFKSSDRGTSWSVYDTPIVKGDPATGIFSIAMIDATNGVIVGGDYADANSRENHVVATTSSGGSTWDVLPAKTLQKDASVSFVDPRVGGYRSGVAVVEKNTLIAVGTNGSDRSTDRGKSWEKIGSEDLNAVAAKGKKAVWAVGPKGTVLRMSSTPASRTGQSGSVRNKDCPIGGVIDASSATAKPGDTIRFKFSVKDWNGNRPRYPWAISEGGRIISGQDSPVIEIKVTNEADKLTAVVWLGDDEIACENHPQETVEVVR